MVKQPLVAELKIMELSKEGLGRGIWQLSEEQSYQIDVPFTLPGDEVRVKLFKRKGRAYSSQLLDILQPSDQRVAPRCLHFGKCGGCKWQQIPYEEQLKIKERAVARYLEPYLTPSSTFYPILPCDPPWNYRNKMELTFSNDKAGNYYLGLILYGTRGHVFQMEECYLAPSWVIDGVNAITAWWKDSKLLAYHSGGDRGALRTLTLREGVRSGDRMVFLTVSGNPNYAMNREQIDSFVKAAREALEPTLPDYAKLSIFLRIQQIAKGQKTQFFEMRLFGPDHIRETIHLECGDKGKHSLNFQISPTAFFQPNTRQAEKLYSRAIEMTRLNPDSIVYDLYCGTGTLGICLAKQVKEVVGIELSPESSLDARENVKLNQLSNVSILTGDVAIVLPKLLAEKNQKPDVLLVDPPRAGLDAKALKLLLDINASQLTYISCNPVTQAENVEQLLKGGYRVKMVQPVDQFPQTIHVENIIVLEK